MKKIIGGKKYDTATAKLVGAFDEATGKKIQSFSLSQTAIAGLKRLAQTCQTSRSDIIEQLVSKALKESQNA